MSAPQSTTSLLDRFRSAGFLTVLAGIAFPWVSVQLTGGTFWVSHGVEFLIFGIIVVGFDLLYGYTGLLSFGHSLFFGGASYVTAVGMTQFGLPYAMATVAALITMLLVAVIVGALSLRLTALYFAIITLAFAQLSYQFIIQFSDITGGVNGLSLTLPNVADIPISNSYFAYYLGLVVLVVVYYVTRRVVRSPFGRVIQGVKVNEERMEMLGVNPYRQKLVAFVISAFIASVAGVLYPLYLGFVDPSIAHWLTSGDVLIMSLIGGFQSLWGPVIGVGIFITSKTVLSGYLEAWRIPLGAMFVAFVLFAPSGIAGLVSESNSVGVDRIQTIIDHWRGDR